MKEAFIECIREFVYDIHPNWCEDMHRDVMKTVLMCKDRDREMKRAPKRPATTTLQSDQCGTSSGWQPAPHMWPSAVQNPVSVSMSMEPSWVQKQFPQQRQFHPNQQQSQHSIHPQQLHQSFQPQQPRSFLSQLQEDQQHDTPSASISQLTPLASTPVKGHDVNSSFPSGFSSFLEAQRQQGQQREANQDEA